MSPDETAPYRVLSPPAHFDTYVPNDVAAALYKSVTDAYKASYMRAAEHEDPLIARNEAGHVRRAHHERAWLGMAARFGSVSAATVLNASGGYAHVELTINGQVQLTASRSRSPIRLPKASHRRLELSERNGQRIAFAADSLSLFFAPADDGPPVYGIVTYGTYGASVARKPDFVNILFPHRNGFGIVGAVDLHARFGEQALDPDLGLQTREEAGVVLRMKKKSA